jgi:hypothetical protein
MEEIRGREMICPRFQVNGRTQRLRGTLVRIIEISIRNQLLGICNAANTQQPYAQDYSEDTDIFPLHLGNPLTFRV